MRGRERLSVAGWFTASATLSGGLVGLIASVLGAVFLAGWSMIALAPISASEVVVPLIVVGAGLDVLVAVGGRPKPPAGGRQVPREWGRLFSARTVAALYGARLGVGPLTILSTWTWWSVTIGAAMSGLLAGVVVGATFGLVRSSVTLMASLQAEGSSSGHAEWFAWLRRRRPKSWLALDGIGLAAVTLVALIGQGATVLRAEVNEPIVGARPPSASYSMATESDSNPAETGFGPAPTTTAPATLEDFVRSVDTNNTTSTTATDSQAGPDDSTIAESAADGGADDDLPTVLSDELTAEIDGFVTIDDAGADRFLDLSDAAEIQPDPTEEVALLETRGFEGGWTRAFRNDANDVAVASVYQFEDAAEAEFYLEDGLITIGGYGGQFFDIEGLAGVRGFTQTFTDPEGGEELVSLGAAFQAGQRWYLVYFVGSPETVTPEMLIPAIAAQRQAVDA